MELLSLLLYPIKQFHMLSYADHLIPCVIMFIPHAIKSRSGYLQPHTFVLVERIEFHIYVKYAKVLVVCKLSKPFQIPYVAMII